MLPFCISSNFVLLHFFKKHLYYYRMEHVNPSNISLLASLVSTVAQEHPPSNSIMCLANIRPNAKLRYNGGSPSRFKYFFTDVHSMHLHSLGRRAQNSFACSMPRMSLSSNANICLARMGEVRLNLSSSNQDELKHHEEDDLYGS